MWLEIFKSGEFTSSNGKTETFSEDILQQIAEIYNQSIDNSESGIAPLVKGHPETNAPAYGWVEKLARRGKFLVAKVKQLSPEIVDEIKQGRFKKISIALYPNLMLRHVGLLGAIPPAVKGLQMPQFSDADDFTVFESESENEYLEEGTEINIDNNNKDSSESESDNFEINLLKNEISRLEEENQRLQIEKAEQQKNLRLKEYREFANDLIELPNGMILTPAQAEQLVILLDLAYQNEYKINNKMEFAESSKTATVEKIIEFISTLKPQFNLKEFAIKPQIPKQNEEFFHKRNISESRLKMHKRARELQFETPGLTYEEAASKAGMEYVYSNK